MNWSLCCNFAKFDIILVVVLPISLLNLFLYCLLLLSSYTTPILLLYYCCILLLVYYFLVVYYYYCLLLSSSILLLPTTTPSSSTPSSSTAYSSTMPTTIHCLYYSIALCALLLLPTLLYYCLHSTVIFSTCSYLWCLHSSYSTLLSPPLVFYSILMAKGLSPLGPNFETILMAFVWYLQWWFFSHF